MAVVLCTVFRSQSYLFAISRFRCIEGAIDSSKKSAGSYCSSSQLMLETEMKKVRESGMKGLVPLLYRYRTVGHTCVIRHNLDLPQSSFFTNYQDTRDRQEATGTDLHGFHLIFVQKYCIVVIYAAIQLLRVCIGITSW